MIDFIDWKKSNAKILIPHFSIKSLADELSILKVDRVRRFPTGQFMNMKVIHENVRTKIMRIPQKTEFVDFVVFVRLEIATWQKIGTWSSEGRKIRLKK